MTQIDTLWPHRHVQLLLLDLGSYYFAVLPTDGDQLEEAEAKLLGEILKASNIDFSYSGISTQQLLDGESGLTYEEMQFVMKDNPTTRILSMNLKQQLQSSELGMQCE